VVADRGALREMLCVAAEYPRAGMIGAKLLRHDAPETIQAVGGGYILPVLCHDTQLGAGKPANSVNGVPLKLDHLVGASLLVRKDAIADVGPIDETYFLYREETDWCIRMRRAGWELRCATHAVVWHKQCHSVGFKSPIHDYYAVRNMLLLVRKLYPVWLPTAFGYFALRSILPKLVRMESLRLRAVLRAIGDFVRGRDGRCAAHTEEVLLRNYVGRNPDTLLRARKRRNIVVASLLALVFALAGAAAERAVSATWASPAPATVAATRGTRSKRHRVYLTHQHESDRLKARLNGYRSFFETRNTAKSRRQRVHATCPSHNGYGKPSRPLGGGSPNRKAARSSRPCVLPHDSIFPPATSTAYSLKSK
jgi:hypothetical protein